MRRIYSTAPKDGWRWRTETTYAFGVKAAGLVFVGGQLALDDAGRVADPGDHLAQTDVALAHVERVLADFGGTLGDVVRVDLFYLHKPTLDERDLLRRVRGRLPASSSPALTAVPLPRLMYPGLAVEIEVLAAAADGRSALRRAVSRPAGHWAWAEGADFSQGVRLGSLLFLSGQMALDEHGRTLHAGDIVGQSADTLGNIRRVLAALGAEMDDVVKVNTFYVGHGSQADWERAARVRAAAFKKPGPAATAVPVPGLYPNDLLLRQEVIAIRGEDGSRVARDTSWPAGHWDWPIPVPFQQGLRIGDLVLVGGQVALDSAGRLLYPGDLEAQTKASLEHIRRILEGFQLGMDSIVQVRCLYKTDGGPEDAHRVLTVCSGYFSRPAPAMTLVPLEHLAFARMMIEIEAVATTERT
jgi:enamine deaminase RidA (YjgF/YER057c/UK114 family)